MTFKISIRLILGLFIVFISCKREGLVQNRLEGNVFGTRFHMIYLGEEKQTFKKEVDSLFRKVNKSLSTYMATSDISRINKGDSLVFVDAYFEEVFAKSKVIHEQTKGVFDPTIGILVNAWGFGPKKDVKTPDSLAIKNMLSYVGFNKVKLREGRVVKKFPQIYFDFNAIAKGFGVDVVGRFLEEKGIENYLIEIGGEIRARGKNLKGDFWKIGIEQPNFDGTRGIQKVIVLRNASIATSGNYRKFKVDSITGEKYVHTLDTKTGYTARRDLLSASVIAALDCADVDGYATALMAMGSEKAKEFLKEHPELKAYLIYVDRSGEVSEFISEGL